MQYVGDQYNGALSLSDNKGNFPLHFGCLGFVNCDAVMLLLENKTPAVSERDDDGNLPIQLLLCDKANEKHVDQENPQFVEAIWWLLTAYPETINNW